MRFIAAQETTGRPTTRGNHRPLLTSASSFLTFYDLHVRICNINAFRVIGELNTLEHGALERECSGVILRPQRCTQNNRGIRQLKHNDRTSGTPSFFCCSVRISRKAGCFRTSRASSSLAF